MAQSAAVWGPLPPRLPGTSGPRPRAGRAAHRIASRAPHVASADADELLAAGPQDAPPDYSKIDGTIVSRAVMGLFRARMVETLGEDSELEGYDAIIDLTRKLNAKYPEPRDTQLATVKLLGRLFPSWLPGAFAAILSKNIPKASCRLNAWFTAFFCQWLMGPSEVNDVDVDGGQVGVKQGVKIERCRYLEETGCAAICINSCKIPTQEFFAKNMGLPLTMTPDYNDFSCQFSYGLTPGPESEDEALSTPCFQQCPTKRRHLKACDSIVPNATASGPKAPASVAS
ncbi:unnamed protein product [Ostreobium quekettii]|uniref:Beta-carotene isomerase D27-like C-terminal domain-containing protein n=1 Tax=Ostreobium quekettii TaxID=121088 RepID=A0A8S1JFB9_9CHLO|nr:unnamed protein product [Ostreobium quekettii]